MARTRTTLSNATAAPDNTPDAEPEAETAATTEHPPAAEDYVAPESGQDVTDAPTASDNSEPEHVPLSAGKGGRYTMVNGRRVKRTD